jgi:hypothetical protein
MDTLTRRQYLATAIRSAPGPICAATIARLSAAAGFSSNRNTARKDCRALVARGVLAPLPGPGNQTYITKDAPPCDSSSATR